MNSIDLSGTIAVITGAQGAGKEGTVLSAGFDTERSGKTHAETPPFPLLFSAAPREELLPSNKTLPSAPQSHCTKNPTGAGEFILRSFHFPPVRIWM